MDFKFSKDSGDSQQQDAPGEKKNQSALLVLLLILVGGFSYLYFFTDLIRPQEQKPAEAPAPAPPVAKIPLPPRNGAPAAPEAKKPEAPKSAAPAAAVAPAAKPVQAPATKPAPAAAAKPAPAKPKEEVKKAEAAKPADKKQATPPATEKKSVKAATPKTEEKKPASAKKPDTDQKIEAKKDVKKPVAKAKKASSGPWSILVGSYVLEEALSTDMGRVRKAGFEPVVTASARKKSAMNRLFVSEFSDRSSAQTALDKLKRQTSDAFVIEQKGKFVLYAGSYLQSESATSEKDRLKAVGVAVTIRHTDIAIPAQALSVGPFTDKKAADAALGKLKSAGLKATLTQK